MREHRASLLNTEQKSDGVLLGLVDRGSLMIRVTYAPSINKRAACSSSQTAHLNRSIFA